MLGPLRRGNRVKFVVVTFRRLLVTRPPADIVDTVVTCESYESGTADGAIINFLSTSKLGCDTSEAMCETRESAFGLASVEAAVE